MKCGHCGQESASLTHVRSCAGGAVEPARSGDQIASLGSTVEGFWFVACPLHSANEDIKVHAFQLADAYERRLRR